MRAENTSLLIE